MSQARVVAFSVRASWLSSISVLLRFWVLVRFYRTSYQRRRRRRRRRSTCVGKHMSACSYFRLCLLPPLRRLCYSVLKLHAWETPNCPERASDRPTDRPTSIASVALPVFPPLSPLPEHRYHGDCVLISAVFLRLSLSNKRGQFRTSEVAKEPTSCLHNYYFITTTRTYYSIIKQDGRDDKSRRKQRSERFFFTKRDGPKNAIRKLDIFLNVKIFLFFPCHRDNVALSTPTTFQGNNRKREGREEGRENAEKKVFITLLSQRPEKPLAQATSH